VFCKTNKLLRSSRFPKSQSILVNHDEDLHYKDIPDTH